MSYVVHVQRVVRLRAVKCFVQGPFRWRWWARIVAWSYYINSDNVYQDGVVFKAGDEPKREE